MVSTRHSLVLVFVHDLKHVVNVLPRNRIPQVNIRRKKLQKCDILAQLPFGKIVDFENLVVRLLRVVLTLAPASPHLELVRRHQLFEAEHPVFILIHVVEVFLNLPFFFAQIEKVCDEHVDPLFEHSALVE